MLSELKTFLKNIGRHTVLWLSF